MKLIQSIVGLIFITLNEIIKFSIKRPIISLLLIFVVWVNSLPLPAENYYTNHSVIVYNQKSSVDVDAEYAALMGSYPEKTILAADFYDESLNAWNEEEQHSPIREGMDFDYWDDSDSQKESDVPIGYDPEAESTFASLLIRAGFLISPQAQSSNLPGVEYNPGVVISDSNPAQIDQNRRRSIKSEEMLNKRLRKSDREAIGVAIKDSQPFYHAYAQLRDKYYHAWLFDKTPALSKTQLKKLQKQPYKQRLTTLRKLPISDDDIYRLSGLIREHVIDSETVVVRGTLGGNRERKTKLERQTNPKVKITRKLDGYLVYNIKTKVACFYDLKDRNLRTFQLIQGRDDFNDVVKNKNLN